MSTANMPSKFIGMIFLSLGAIYSAYAVDDQNIVSAFIGITLLLWGGILLYVRSDEYIRLDVLRHTSNDLYCTIETLLKEFPDLDKPVYFAERSLEGLNKAQVQFSSPSKGEIILTPPGDGLQRLFEASFTGSFLSVDIFTALPLLTKVIIGKYGLAASLQINEIASSDRVNLTIKGNIYTVNDFNSTWSLIGDPLTSAIACIISRSTGKKVSIESYFVEDTLTEVALNLI